MSKSLKNFISIDEALEKYTARRLRLAFLLQPWSSKMDFRESLMTEVKNSESTLNNFFATVRTHLRDARAKGAAWSDGTPHYGAQEKALMAALTNAQIEYRKAMCDSFDTPTGMAIILDLVSKTNVYVRSEGSAGNSGVLEAVAKWVGDMLRVVGLGEGPVREGQIGWGDAPKAGEAEGDVDVSMRDLALDCSFADSTSRHFTARGTSHALPARALILPRLGTQPGAQRRASRRAAQASRRDPR